MSYSCTLNNVSQGSAATDLKWGEIFSKFLFRNSLLYVAVKKITKIGQYLSELSKNKSVSFFMAHSVESNPLIHTC